MIGVRKNNNRQDSYGLSISDLMSGLVFIFIITVIMFALKLAAVTEKKSTALAEHQEINEARNKLLEDLQQSLRKQGVSVTIDYVNGILRLPEDVLFTAGSANVRRKGKKAITILSQRLALLLNCETTTIVTLCKDKLPKIEAIFIEGHSDEQALKGRVKKRFSTNLNLSAQRAINTYKVMEKRVIKLKNRQGKHLFSISGYGAKRPVEAKPVSYHNLSHWYHKNRRIDVRFIMSKPEILLSESL